MTRKGLSRLVLVLWSTILLTLAGVGFLLMQPSQPSLSSSKDGAPTRTPRPTATATEAPSPTVPAPSPTSRPSPLPPSPSPSAPHPQIIGHSVLERPLEVYQFGSGPIEKIIVAGIHGGYEWNTIALADELIEYLETHPGIIPRDHTLYLLRALNPDGYERSHGFGGRANANNVDINRNFPSNWQPEWDRAGCWDYIPIEGGSAAGSEPETQALMAFVESHQITALISYHSAALGIFPGGQPPDIASLSLAAALAEVSDYPYPPIDAGCEFTGQLVDWISDQGIAGVDVELTNHQDTDFEINLAILSVFLDWSSP